MRGLVRSRKPAANHQAPHPEPSPPQTHRVCRARAGRGSWPATCASRSPSGYRHVQVIVAARGASGVTILGLGRFSEFGGAVHGSTQTPASSLS